MPRPRAKRQSLFLTSSSSSSSPSASSPFKLPPISEQDGDGDENTSSAMLLMDQDLPKISSVARGLPSPAKYAYTSSSSMGDESLERLAWAEQAARGSTKPTTMMAPISPNVEMRRRRSPRKSFAPGEDDVASQPATRPKRSLPSLLEFSPKRSRRSRGRASRTDDTPSPSNPPSPPLFMSPSSPPPSELLRLMGKSPSPSKRASSSARLYEAKPSSPLRRLAARASWGDENVDGVDIGRRSGDGGHAHEDDNGAAAGDGGLGPFPSESSADNAEMHADGKVATLPDTAAVAAARPSRPRPHEAFKSKLVSPVKRKREDAREAENGREEKGNTPRKSAQTPVSGRTASKSHLSPDKKRKAVAEDVAAVSSKSPVQRSVAAPLATSPAKKAVRPAAAATSPAKKRRVVESVVPSASGSASASLVKKKVAANASPGKKVAKCTAPPAVASSCKGVGTAVEPPAEKMRTAILAFPNKQVETPAPGPAAAASVATKRQVAATAAASPARKTAPATIASPARKYIVEKSPKPDQATEREGRTTSSTGVRSREARTAAPLVTRGSGRTASAAPAAPAGDAAAVAPSPRRQPNQSVDLERGVAPAKTESRPVSAKHSKPRSRESPSAAAEPAALASSNTPTINMPTESAATEPPQPAATSPPAPEGRMPSATHRSPSSPRVQAQPTPSTAQIRTTPSPAKTRSRNTPSPKKVRSTTFSSRSGAAAKSQDVVRDAKAAAIAASRPQPSNSKAATTTHSATTARSAPPTRRLPSTVVVPDGFRLTSTGSLVPVAPTLPKGESVPFAPSASHQAKLQKAIEEEERIRKERAQVKAHQVPDYLKQRRLELEQEREAELQREIDFIRQQEAGRSGGGAGATTSRKNLSESLMGTRPSTRNRTTSSTAAAPAPFVSSLELRHQERQAWEAKRKAREELLDNERKRAREERQRREDEELKTERERRVPKAHPVPDYIYGSSKRGEGAPR